MIIKLALLAITTPLAISMASAQHHGSYAGQQARSIKAISNEETAQYLAGAGMGYAKAAELNGYPGPMHVLELADKLNLSAEQKEATQMLMDQHKAEARRLGIKKVDAEQALDALFRANNVAPERLATAVRAAADAEGEYRLSHLETHRKMQALLSKHQIMQYSVLRGYESSSHRH